MGEVPGSAQIVTSSTAAPPFHIASNPHGLSNSQPCAFAVASGSVQTLAALSILAIGLYLFQGGFDVIRSQVLVRVGAQLWIAGEGCDHAADELGVLGTVQ